MSYAETDALLAVMEGRQADARELLEDFMPMELATFTHQIHELLTLAREVRDAR